MRWLFGLYALFWLGANNILYKGVIINYKEIANWEDKFIPRFIEDNTVLSPSNHFKYKGYIYDLSENNLENDIHVTISDFNKLQFSLFSRCVFSKIDRTQHHPVLKLISIVHNLINGNAKVTEPLIVYNANNYPTSLNN